MKEGKPHKSPPMLYVPVVNKIQEQLSNIITGKRYEKLTTSTSTQAHLSRFSTGLVDICYTACKKCEKVQKDWKKVVPDIITDKEKIAEEADTQTVLKGLQKMQNTFFTVQRVDGTNLLSVKQWGA